MAKVSPWAKFLEQQAARPPLVFVHGMRHATPLLPHCPPHAHAELEIVYHPVGRGATTVAGRAVEFGQGSVMIHPPGQEHDQIMETAGEDLCVKIAAPSGGPAFPRECLHVDRIDTPALIEDLRLLAGVGATLQPAGQALCNLRATTVLLSLVELACRSRDHEQASHAERCVAQAEEYLREHFATVGSLREVAEAVGLSADYLRHEFRRQRGCSLIDYVTTLRVDRARTLLVHSRLPLKQIATLCGFRDEYYFSRVFQRRTRTTPARYRAKAGA